jgi:hypothetical protein
VVIPSLPGYGLSGKPAATGWDPDWIARACAVLMQRLGAITRDDWLDNSSLYWLTNTAISAARLYWQQAVTGKNFCAAANVSLPAAVTVFRRNMPPRRAAGPRGPTTS